MKKFKNVLAITAVVVMAFAMTACGAAPTVDEEPSDTVVDVVDEVTPDAEEPVVEEPAVEEPAIEEPAVEEPVVEEPAVEEPVVEEPVVEEPVVEEPVVEEPVVEEPVVEEPVVEEPVVEEPVVEEPAVEPTPEAPTLIAKPLAWDTATAITDVLSGLNDNGEQYMTLKYADGTSETHRMIWNDDNNEYIIVYLVFYADGSDQGGDYRVSDMPKEAPKVGDIPYPAAAPEVPVSTDLVINFANLTAGGYGYEASVDGDVVNVSIATNTQEIQYVLPEVIDLAEYKTLIVDVTSNGQLDIKLVDPNATTNQYSQLEPFLNKYTGTGPSDPITAPVEIDLTPYADKDVSQINFMACNNGLEFTIKSITFVK